MNLNAAPAEFSPSENPGSVGPELYLIQDLIQGGGEGVADGQDSERHADLYAVPDVASDAVSGVDSSPAAEAGHELSDGGTDSETSDAHQRVVKNGGRVLRLVSTGTSGVERTRSSDSEHRRRGGGGGGWAFREYLRQREAKEHKAKCGGCPDCPA